MRALAVCERWLCAPVSSFHFHHLSIPPVLLPPTLRPFLPPFLLHPSVPQRELQILSEAKSILQREQPRQQRARAAALKLALRLLYLTSHNALYRTHTPPAFTRRICTEYKAPEQFFPFTLPIPTRPPLSEVAANLSGGGVSGRIVSLFQSMRIVSARSLSFCLLRRAGHLQLVRIHSVTVQKAEGGGEG